MSFAWGRRNHRLRLVTAAIVAVAYLLLAASAGAEVRSGSATDPVESYKPAGRDITQVSASYDSDAGRVSATVTTRGEANEPDTYMLVQFGVLDGELCIEPEMHLGAGEADGNAEWLLDGVAAPAEKNASGASTSLAVTAAALVGKPYSCVDVYLIDKTDEEGPETLAVPLPLVGPAPPPTPPPAPSPPAPPAPPPTPKVAKLTFPSKTATVHRNAWKKVTVKVTNTGNGGAGKVVLRLGKAKGVAIKPKSGKLKLKSIAAGKSKVAKFKVRLTKKAKSKTKLSLKLRGAHGVKASGRLTVEVWKKKEKKEGKKEKEASASLAEKIFYAYKTETSHSATLIGYAFIDAEWAYHGVPAEGLPACTEITGNAENEGCVKYRYDPETKAVQVGSLTGTINAGGQLELDGETYFATSIPAAGTRLQVEQEFIGFSGLCGLITGCSTWHEHLVLSNSGEFILSTESLTTIGGDGPGEIFVAAGNYPPDQHGTYAIEKGARIKLSYADGTVQTKTIAILLNQEGKPDPVYEGLLIGQNYFTFAHTE